MLDDGGCVQCQTKRNVTKTENAQKDGMKTQRKRETKETKAKSMRDNHALLEGRQRKKGAASGRGRGRGRSSHSFQLNEMMCL